MRGVCCLVRVLIVILTLSAKVLSVSGEQCPVCRKKSICKFEKKNFDNSKFYFKVNGTMGFLNQVVIVDFTQNDIFKLRCNSKLNQIGYKLPADDPALPTLPQLTKVKTVEIQGCTVPLNSSYHHALKDINVTFLENEDNTLELTELQPEPRLEGYHMEGLLVKTLVIGAYRIHRPNVGFLDKMQKLHNLSIRENMVLEKDVIEQLPEGLVELNLTKTQFSTALSNASFWLGRMRSLTTLHLEEIKSSESAEFELIPPPLASLPNLTTAILQYVPMKPLPQNWLKGSKLQTLTLTSCEIEKLPDNLFEGANLTKLELSQNRLSSLPPGVFSPLQWLTELDLSSNNLKFSDLEETMSPLKRLEILKINNNSGLGSLCGDKIIQAGIHNSPLPKSLRHLELNDTGATRICDDWIGGDFLMYIVLDFNNISYLTLSDLMLRRHSSMENTPVTLSLLNNSLEKITVTQEDYNTCLDNEIRKWKNPKPVQVKLRLNQQLACNCYDGYWLRETLRKCSLLTIISEKSDITCYPQPPDFEPRTLIAHEPQDFTCPYDGFCTPECECSRRVFDNATVMRCSEALPLEPQWPPWDAEWPLVLYVPPGTVSSVPPLKLIELYAPNNNITSIDETDIPDTLLKLDVRNNNITHITPNAAQKLLRQQTSLYISGNRLTCSCEDAPAIAKLKLAEVRDWNLTQCADGTPLGKTDIENCESNNMIILLAVASIVLANITVALVLRYFLPQIRQFLFDNNMCLKWALNVKDDPDDPMKSKDVFVSSASADDKFAKILIKKLEERGYSTIEHSRDWLPGIPITQQIAHSVKSARRTLLLVSDNFTNSMWGLKEFQTAHAHAMEHRSARVIVVRCELHAPHKLPEEMQLYLKNNTYLDWSDSYFWDKLWRVMPTPRSTLTSAIALMPNQEARPSIGIQLTPQVTNGFALSQSWLMVNKDPPLSELMLAPHVSAEASPRQPSARTVLITHVTLEPPPSKGH